MKEEDSNWIAAPIWASQVLSFLFSVSSKSSLSPHKGRQRTDIFSSAFLRNVHKTKAKRCSQDSVSFSPLCVWGPIRNRQLLTA